MLWFCEKQLALTLLLQMDPKFLRNLKFARAGNKKAKKAESKKAE